MADKSQWRTAASVITPMLQHLLPLIPSYSGTLPTGIAVVGALVGMSLWLAGVMFGRTLVPLVAVTVGGGLGMLLPRWCGWDVNSMATAVGGAVVLGVVAYAAYEFAVAVGLGVVFMCWAALGTWVVCAVGTSWGWPAPDPAGTVPDYLLAVWRDLPDRVRATLPMACGIGLTVGLTLTLLIPRLGQVLLYSTAGATLMFGLAIAAIQWGRPEWMAIFPAQTWAQLLTIGAVTTFGACVQWQLSGEFLPGAATAKPKQKKKDEPANPLPYLGYNNPL